MVDIVNSQPRIFAGPSPWPELIEMVKSYGVLVTSPRDAEIILWFGRDPSEIVGEWSDNLKWLQLPDAGIERWLLPQILDGEFQTTSAAGAYGSQVAEHALAMILAGHHEIVSSARSMSWDPKSLKVRTLKGSTVLIVGAGGIGRHLARLLKGLGCEVAFGTRETGRLAEDWTEIPFDQLLDQLHAFDVVVLACPSTGKTRGMVDAGFLEHMDRDASLINVSRGDLVVTEDLVSALINGTIRFAALDVTDPEPLPPSHALFNLSNCLVTPHVANPPSAKMEGFVNFARENLELFQQGRTLNGLISSSKGY